ncbi:MBOAT family protein [Evansella sp. AB-rgal1]|uniref:MBOAT family O-acyltransferase n=1 Tax=Evansella sp. AB-rgal1 TaxID=3242696 RepID=UPI00359E646A
MLFNSYVFIFAFLPIVFLLYFLLTYLKLIRVSKIWLIASSLFFYSYWNIIYLPLIVGSFVANYIIGMYLSKGSKPKKAILVIGITANVLLLGYFKYYDFFIANINTLTDYSFSLLNLALPLAISFFTFQQIAFLVDAYRKEMNEYSFLDYTLFVTFFPQLIAGPIVHHKEMMPQFMNVGNKFINFRNISMGIFIFSIGLFKKVAIADTFAVWANKGFTESETLTFFEGWITSLSYTFQLYFDFSGYTDMAIGIALLFNIRLPINFNSPYKSLNIQDFWRRWHMTLGRFLTKYIYIPLGGNRKGEGRTYVNILIIFLISGLWHGAGWTFVFWGFLHGLATVIHRFWTKLNLKMNKLLAWFITFQFVNISWVFFRAETWQDAINVSKSMIGLNGIYFPPVLALHFPSWIPQEWSKRYFVGTEEDLYFTLYFLLITFIIVVFAKNSVERLEGFKPNWFNVIFSGIIFVTSVLLLTKVSEFLYFNF